MQLNSAILFTFFSLSSPENVQETDFKGDEIFLYLIIHFPYPLTSTHVFSFFWPGMMMLQ